MTWVLIIAAAIAVSDHITKQLVVRFIGIEECRVIVAGFFNVVNWRNTGAAWGIFQDYNQVLAGVSIVTILVLYLFRHSLQLQYKASRVALGLIAGGILGNLADRLHTGCVIDFLDFYVGRYHWPAFNVADSAICVGVGLYVIMSWRSDPAAQPAPAK